MRHGCLKVILLSFSLLATACAHWKPVAHEARIAARETGKDMKQAGQQVGHAVAEGAKEVGHAAAGAARETGHAFRDGAKKLKPRH